MGEKLGRVNFAVSCNAAAQRQFNRAVALLHSFWYDEAARGFGDVAKSDPKCGMAYWGVAMSFYHQVPTTADRDLTLANDAIAHFKEIEEMTRTLPNGTTATRYNDKMFNEENVYIADDKIFDFFEIKTLPFCRKRTRVKTDAIPFAILDG